MPELVRTATLKLIQSRCSALQVTTITRHADVPMAVQAMKSGAADLIDKLVFNETLIDSIQAVLERSRRNAGDIALAHLTRERFGTPTPDELAATALIGDGFASSIIAATFSNSVRTVNHHRASIHAKMQVPYLP